MPDGFRGVMVVGSGDVLGSCDQCMVAKWQRGTSERNDHWLYDLTGWKNSGSQTTLWWQFDGMCQMRHPRSIKETIIDLSKNFFFFCFRFDTHVPYVLRTLFGGRNMGRRKLINIFLSFFCHCLSHSGVVFIYFTTAKLPHEHTVWAVWFWN